jgi:hypothetical protein
MHICIHIEELQKYNDCSTYRFESEEVLNE